MEHMKCNEKVRYAVVGLRHGMEHIGVGLKNSRVEIVAVCDRDKTKMEHAMAHVRDVQGADVAGKVRAFDDYQRMLDWGEFDASRDCHAHHGAQGHGDPGHPSEEAYSAGKANGHHSG